MPDDTEILNTSLRLLEGDITEQVVDAIVNAANPTLLGGGGVDGAIHRRGGPEVLAACREIRSTRYPGGLPTGAAVATTAGRLSARWVIHTVGPVWKGGDSSEAELLRSAYRSSLEEAYRVGARTVAFPSISTGAYGYPVEEAAAVAVARIQRSIGEHPDAFDELRIVAFSDRDMSAYRQALRGLGREPGGTP